MHRMRRCMGLVACVTAIYMLLVALGKSNAVAARKRTFSIDPYSFTFLKDGKPFQYISGSMHYSRIPSDYWRDRIEKAKKMGLDAIEFYIPWNFHEFEKGRYLFDKDQNLEHFIQLIQKYDLLAIVRPGPYICAEWAFGGLPPWLLQKNPKMMLRSSDPSYFEEVHTWFEVLLPILRKYLYSNGGPIIMVQMENEYGSYSQCDRLYMSSLYNLSREHLGKDVILFTTDGDSTSLLKCGSPDVRYLATIDFGPNNRDPSHAFDSVQSFRPDQPWVNSEFYSGWFDSWNSKHAATDEGLLATSLNSLMTYSTRVNINLYMFHGGTNFGFWSAKAITTSYDYDAPLSEAGDVTRKYERLRAMIYAFKKLDPPPLPKNVTRTKYATITMEPGSHILLKLDKGTIGEKPLNMEALGQFEGFMVYRANISVPHKSQFKVTLEKFRTMVYIFTATQKMDSFHWHITLNDSVHEATIELPPNSTHNQLVFLVENIGYVNYGDGLQNNVQGILGKVELDSEELSPWNMIPVPHPLQILDERYENMPAGLPTTGTVYIGKLDIQTDNQRHDTYIQPEGFSRGLISVNGFILGRYDQDMGPQLRLYLPKQFLQVGFNRFTLLELRNVSTPLPVISFWKEQRWLK